MSDSFAGKSPSKMNRDNKRETSFRTQGVVTRSQNKEVLKAQEQTLHVRTRHVLLVPAMLVVT